MSLAQGFKRWYAKEQAKRRSIRERLVHLETLRAEMLPPILAVSFVGLALQAALFVWAGVPKSTFFPSGTTVFPAVCLLASAASLRWGAKKWRTQLAISTLFVGIALAVTWSQAALLKTPNNGYPQYGGLLILTILLSGLLIGEFYVGIWTFICCGSLQFAVMESNSWQVNAGWSAVYVAAGWLVILFSRRLERLFESNRIAEEQRRDAIVAERTRFARDIHDTLAQGFTGIMMQLNAAEQRLQGDSADARAHIEKARQLAGESLEEARRSVSALRIASGSLLDAIEQIARKLTSDSGVHLDTKLEGQPYALPEQCEANLVRIAQEALTNAARHSGAVRMSVRLAYQTGSVVLEVGDSGRGMSGVEPSGFGVDGMRERARHIGAELRIVSDPGRGTRIIVTVPNA
jgi:signal transduction histidine kinase